MSPAPATSPATLPGAEPLAAVFGGIVMLAASAVALVLLRDRLRLGRRWPAWVWLLGGAAFGELLFVAGLWAMGRGAELAWRGALTQGVPWALALTMAAGALLAFATGHRAQWHPAGVAVLGSLSLACVGWGAYLVTTRVGAFLGAPGLVTGALVALLFAQLVALILVCCVGAYMLDRLVRRRWSRRAAHDVPYDADARPVVALHVACYDEPVDVVLATLDSIAALDYPPGRLHAMLVDDSSDPAVVETLRTACAERGIDFLHRVERSGFKAGALNAALRATRPDAELVAVVDADFVVQPDFLAKNVGYFADAKLAFVQTKLAYRNSDESFTARYASMMEHFFYSSMMHTRNEGNAILFCGTMGIVRRAAIEHVGGWCDGHVGEDVDLSCRMLMRGWTCLYVPEEFGRGLQTPDHESFRRQQARWAYGGARILRDHGRELVVGTMTPTQKAHHLYGPIFWLDGSLALLFAASMTFFAAAFLTGSLGRLPVHDLVFVGLVPILIILENMLRSAFTMRRLLGIRKRDVASMILLGWSGKLLNALSAWAALLRIPRPFHRTPKGGGEGRSLRDAARQALRVAPIETAMGALQVTLGVAMTTRLAIAGADGLPPLLIACAILMTVVWSAYFLAAPACVILGHVTRRASNNVQGEGRHRPGSWTPRSSTSSARSSQG